MVAMIKRCFFKPTSPLPSYLSDHRLNVDAMLVTIDPQIIILRFLRATTLKLTTSSNKNERADLKEPRFCNV